jgi:hypothetical protein
MALTASMIVLNLVEFLQAPEKATRILYCGYMV